MFKRPYILAIVSLLLIPAVAVLGGILFFPSIRKSPPVMRIMSLWFLPCFFLVRSKKRSYG